MGITFKSTRGGLPQDQALVFERLPRHHHVLLAEGVAVLQLGRAAVLHAVPHLLQLLMLLIIIDAEIHGCYHLSNLSQGSGKVGVLLRFL